MALLSGIGNYFKKLYSPGAFKGAASGAAAGSAFGPYGAAGGGILGALLGMGKSSAFHGKKPSIQQVSALSGKQQKLLNNLLKNITKKQGPAFHILNKLMRNRPMQFEAPGFETPDVGFEYEALEKPILERWQSQILPSILERFAAGGNKNSSGLQQTLGQAGRGVSQDLATLYGGLLNQQAGLRNENAWRSINLNNQNYWNAAQMNQNAALNSNAQRQNALNTLFNVGQSSLQPGYNQTIVNGGQPGVFQAMAPGMGSALGNMAFQNLLGGQTGGIMG